MFHKDAIESTTLELLIKLQNTECLKDFHLVGGTSLAIQIGHRKSVDLDLFSQYDFDVNTLLEYLEEKFQFELSYSSKNTLKGNIGDVKIDFLTHKYPFIKNPISIEGASLLSIEDIAAMKLNAITGNGTRSKDFIDIYFILKQYSVEDILHFYNIKYSSRNQLHVIKSLIYFKDIDTKDWPVMILEKNLSLPKVKRAIETSVNSFSNKLKDDN